MEKTKNLRELQRKRHIIWHAFASFCITPKMQDAVLTFFETPDNALSASEREWDNFFRLAEQFEFTETEKASIREVRKRDHEKAYRETEAQCIGFVTQEDEEYPEKLRKTFSAPRYFYYKGNLPGEAPSVAVIGARKCSHYGSEIAWRIARELAGQGIGVISGLAYGVDKAAHDGALAGGGMTYGILGCGPDVCYPMGHKDTYDRILATGGGIISEYPPGTRPLSWFFPQRNRIIAGLSDGILVTEARKKSGTLITVSFGLEYGKNIYAVPGRVDDVLSEGCNYLIKEGAKLTLSAEDILEDLQPVMSVKTKKNSVHKCKNYEFLKNILASNEKMVYASLRLKPKHIEEIREETKLSPGELAAILENLSSLGCIKRFGQAYYALSEGTNLLLKER